MRSVRMAMAAAVVCLTAGMVFAAEEAKVVQLPAPQKEGGKPLMQALAERRSTRAFGSRELSEQMLSNLLWAADGVNRADGKRTAPSAMNWQDVDIYVATAKGTWMYDAKANTLAPVSGEDLRAASGRQGYVAEAPVNLIYVSDYAKMRSRGTISDRDKDMWASAEVGCIAQNVYLFSASEGLNAVVRGMIPREELGPKLKLRPEQKIILAQAVGYPKE